MGVVEQPVTQLTWITGQATTTVKIGSGVLERLIFPTPVATATVKIYDSLAASGIVLLETITWPATPIVPVLMELDLSFNIGCTVVTGVANEAVGVATR